MMRGLLINAEEGKFVVRDNGWVFQVGELDSVAVMLNHISDGKKVPVSFANAAREEVEILDACPVCNGFGDSLDNDCLSCDGRGFQWED